LRSSSWLLIGQIATAASQFAFALVRARGLSVDEYGAWAFGAALVSLFGVLADFGTSVVVVRELSTDVADRRRLLQTATALNLALAMVVVASVAFTVVLLRPGRAVFLVAAMYSCQLSITAAGSVPVAFNRARHDVGPEAWGRGVQGALLVVGACILLRLGSGMAGYIILAPVAALAAPVPVILRAHRAYGWITPRVDRSEAVRILRIASPIGLGMAATSVYYYFDSVLMGAAGQHHAVAVYGAAYSLLFGATLLVGPLQWAFMPVLACASSAGWREFRQSLASFVRISAAAAVPVAVVGPLSASLLMTKLFGNSFADGASPLRLLMVAGGVMFFSSALGTGLLALGGQKTYLRVVLAGAGVNVALNLLLIPRFSATGAASATLVAEGVVAALMAHSVRAAIRTWAANSRPPDENPLLGSGARAAA